jgi:flagellar hook-associated protein 3 FlgL
MVNLNLAPAAATFLTDIAQIRNATNQAQQQISSGYKIQQASDAPDQISALLQLEANLQNNAQVTKNLGTVKTVTDTAESGLNSAIQLTESAMSAGSQGAGTSSTTAQRQTLAQQVQSILTQLVGITNLTVQGKFIFSGDAPSSSPYKLDLTSASGVGRLVTTTATQQIRDANGDSFAVGKTAQDIFDHRNPDDTTASDNLFVAVNSLRVALANDDTPGINTALASLHTAADYVNTQQAYYGSVQDRIASATTAAQSQNVSLKTGISGIRDADLTQAAIELSAGQTQQSAAYSAQAKQPKTSLFDYLG